MPGILPRSGRFIEQTTFQHPPWPRPCHAWCSCASWQSQPPAKAVRTWGNWTASGVISDPPHLPRRPATAELVL